VHLGEEAARLDGRVPATGLTLVTQQWAGPADAGDDHGDVAGSADVPERLDDAALALVAHAQNRGGGTCDLDWRPVADGLADGRRRADDDRHERGSREREPIAQTPP
jgi:hypothetical protein